MFYSAIFELLTILVTACSSDTVTLNLRTGYVNGVLGRRIQLLSSLIPEDIVTVCKVQSLFKIDLTGSPEDTVKFTIHYSSTEVPKMWTLNIGDSVHNAGNGENVTSSPYSSELVIQNQQLRIYSNTRDSFEMSAVNGFNLIKVIDNFTTSESSTLVEIRDEGLQWSSGDSQGNMESRYLFTIKDTQPADQVLYASFNRVISTHLRNGTGLCEVTISTSQSQVDECQVGDNTCHRNAECTKTRTGMKCKCSRGFIGNATHCEDIDECAYQNGGCVQQCENTEGSYLCSCLLGFRLDYDGFNCLDENECTNNNGGCDHICTNILGSRKCTCRVGYRLLPDGHSCEVLPEDFMMACGKCEQICVTLPTEGYAECSCENGFTLGRNGRSCKLRQCSYANGVCQHKCIQRKRKTSCMCAPDYKLKMVEGESHCIPLCKLNNGNCDYRCTDTEDGPVCSCPDGYILGENQRSCEDVDECLADNGGCSHQCENTAGGHHCLCPAGYSTNPTTHICEDIDECEFINLCDQTCINTAGSYTCSCESGYQLYGESHCGAVDECSVDNGGCSHVCTNLNDGFQCSCPPDHDLHANGADCVNKRICPAFRNTNPFTQSDCAEEGEWTHCNIHCEPDSYPLYELDDDGAIYDCGPDTQFEYQSRTQIQPLRCSRKRLIPSKGRTVRLTVESEQQCEDITEKTAAFSSLITRTINNIQTCNQDCTYEEPIIECRSKKRKSIATLIFNLKTSHIGEVIPNEEYKKHDKLSNRKMKQMIKAFRLMAKSDSEIPLNSSVILMPTKRKPIRVSKVHLNCTEGSTLVKNSCIACSIGTYYNGRQCSVCPDGMYQDEEGQSMCKPCPDSSQNNSTVTRPIACGGVCEPGTISADGNQPCQPCSVGTYQPHAGRTQCQQCPGGSITSASGATSFSDCMVDHCLEGYYYDRKAGECELCGKGYYQPKPQSDYCMKCPNGSDTDDIGSKTIDDCKERQCGRVFNSSHGYIRSPNWPGDYPVNAECTWEITPEDGKKILVVVPEVLLGDPSDELCDDILAMRQSESPYSVQSFETCSSTNHPLAFIARSDSLWIRFKSDDKGGGKGFNIPFVKFNREFEPLISSIIRDSRLYMSPNHRELFKDMKLLDGLLQVTSDPLKYYLYNDEQKNILPQSFRDIISNKIQQFYNSNTN